MSVYSVTCDMLILSLPRGADKRGYLGEFKD